MFSQTTPRENEINFLPYVGGAFYGTVFSHVPRVWLNRSAYHHSITAVLTETSSHWHKAIIFNLTRCFSAVTAQTITKAQAQKYFERDSLICSTLGALAGASFALALETPVIRKTTQQITYQQKMAFTKCSLPLAGFYFSRDLGVVMSVFGERDFTSPLYLMKLALAAIITTPLHKFATLEATTDMLEAAKQGTTPNFTRDGTLSTLRNMARGNVYTHPAFKVSIQNPNTYCDLGKNLLLLSCTPNAVFFRLVYLLIIAKSYGDGFNYATQHPLSFWNKKTTQLPTVSNDKHQIITRVISADTARTNRPTL